MSNESNQTRSVTFEVQAIATSEFVVGHHKMRPDMTFTYGPLELRSHAVNIADDMRGDPKWKDVEIYRVIETKARERVHESTKV